MADKGEMERLCYVLVREELLITSRADHVQITSCESQTLIYLIACLFVNALFKEGEN